MDIVRVQLIHRQNFGDAVIPLFAFNQEPPRIIILTRMVKSKKMGHLCIMSEKTICIK